MQLFSHTMCVDALLTAIAFDHSDAAYFSHDEWQNSLDALEKSLLSGAGET